MWSDVSAGLPTTGSPKTRSKLFYGLDDEAELGITYNYSYTPFYTSTAWEDAFFGSSRASRRPSRERCSRTSTTPRTARATSARTTGSTRGRSRSGSSSTRPPGVDLTKPTILFVNWADRPDFKFHVYTKTNEPDPDTGYNFGVIRDSRKIVAWGGTAPDDEENPYAGDPRRLWFYDLSAGPESGAAASTSRTRTSTATASPTTASRTSGSTRARRSRTTILASGRRR